MTAPDVSASGKKGLGFAITALVFAVCGLLLPAVPLVELYEVPDGTAVRPMGLAAAIFFAGFGTPWVVAPFAWMAFIRRGLHRWLGLSAFILSLLPIPLYWLLFDWIMNAHHLTPKP